MKIILDKKKISYIRKKRKENPNREIGFIIKDDKLIFYKGKKYEIIMPNDENEICIHTHPSFLGKNYSPPSGTDIKISLKNPYKDEVIFDEYGIWIYRPDNILIMYLQKLHFNKKFIQGISDYCQKEGLKLNANQININQYLKIMKKIYYVEEIQKWYGLKIKYILYKNIDDIILYQKY